MTDPDFSKRLMGVAKEAKGTLFKEPHKESDYEALGILCAQACMWEKTRIKTVILTILEDSNFHEMHSEVEELFNGTKETVQETTKGGNKDKMQLDSTIHHIECRINTIESTLSDIANDHKDKFAMQASLFTKALKDAGIYIDEEVEE